MNLKQKVNIEILISDFESRKGKVKEKSNCQSYFILIVFLLSGWGQEPVGQLGESESGQMINLKFSCPVSRGERETWIHFPSFERRKRNLEFLCPISRTEREIGKFIKLSRR